MILDSSSPRNNRPPAERREVHERLVSVPSDFMSPDGSPIDIKVDPQAPCVFYFDIDNTLLKSRDIHGPSIIAVFEKVFGSAFAELRARVSDTELIDTYVASWGKGDREEFKILARHYGLLPPHPTDDEQKREDGILDQMTTMYVSVMAETIQQLHDTQGPEYMEQVLLPGARVFLDEMRRRHIPGVIVTGNSEKTVDAMMRYFDLGKYFITGGYDSDRDAGITDKYPRAYILEAAQKKLRTRFQSLHVAFAELDTAVVVGDTPSDLKATGYQDHDDPTRFHTLLVSTGTHSLEKLVGPHEVRDGAMLQPHLVTQLLSRVKIQPFFDGLERIRRNTQAAR